MGAVLPAINSLALTYRRTRVTDHPFVKADTTVLDSGDVDAGSTPTAIIRPGNVVVLRTSTGRYVEANDAAGDRNTAPSKTSSGHTDGNGVIRIVGNHGSVSVTTTTGAGTEANNATDLNADAEFAAHYLASSAGGELTIAALGTGALEWFYVHADTMATAAFSEGEDNGVVGADADYRVTEEFVDLRDPVNQAAAHAEVAASIVGHYDVSELTNLTAEARAVLARRGSIFG